MDYTAYGYGYYAGPYWVTISEAESEAAGTTYFTQDGNSFAWGFTYSQEQTVDTFFNYCDYVYGSYAVASYLTSDANQGAVDCTGETADTWTFSGTAGDNIAVTVDTIAADSASDMVFFVNGPDTCTVATADDSFDCTFPPVDYQCPSLAYTLEETGTYEVVVFS
ncbi:MAG: pre-peptidase C-terminal domain-containing protein, partial [bacterium]